jgi:hypothetical protein
MLGYANDLAMAVIVASSAFAGVTVVMLGRVADRKLIAGVSRLSLGSGIFAVASAIAWFLWGQIDAILYISVVFLLFQIYTAWATVDSVLQFWARKQQKKMKQKDTD